MKISSQQLFLFLLLLIFIPVSVSADPVSLERAQKIARGKIITLGKSDHFSISARIFEFSNDDQYPLFFLFHLVPNGFIIVAGNDHLPPVMAYSFSDEFSVEHREYHSMVKFLKLDINLRLENLNRLPESVVNDRKSEWKVLDECSNAVKQTGFFQQWPPEGTTSTGGWLETNWTQSTPYNNFCPMDPVTNQRSVAGCPATAMAQILNYYKVLNNTVFSDNDDYHHNYAGRNYWIDDDHIPIDFPSFPDLNAYLDTVNQSFENGTLLKNNEKAAITFACGVAAHQVFTSQVSGTFGVNQAQDAYLRFGFSDALLLQNTDTSLFSKLSKNMMEGRPAHLAVVDPGWTMGHNVVADGYNTDDFYHLNFGWGGGYNGWYMLPDEIPYGLTVIEGVIVDIAWAPVNTGIENFFQPDSGISLVIFPNPAKDFLLVKFELDEPSWVSMVLFDSKGSSVIILEREFISAGSFERHFKLNKSDNLIKTGNYLFNLRTRDKSITRKLLVK